MNRCGGAICNVCNTANSVNYSVNITCLNTGTLKSFGMVSVQFHPD